MGNSLMVGCAKMGLHFTACAPKKYQPDAALVEQCRAIAAETGAAISFEEDPAKAAKGADVLYTDVWVSMGEPVEVWAERINDLAAYQINQQLMDIAGPKAVFMHCLPAYHDHKTCLLYTSGLSASGGAPAPARSQTGPVRGSSSVLP